MLYNIIMIKLIVFDLDGTLAPIERPLTEKTINQLLEIQKKGVEIAIASGKTIYYLCGLCRQLPLVNPILVGENGAIIQKGIHSPSSIYIRNYYSEDSMKSLSTLKEKLESSIDYIFYQPNEAGLSFFPTSDNFPKINEIIDSTELKDCTVYRHSDGFDVMPSTITKGTGLKLLAEAINASPEEIIAIGDGTNDVPMFEFVKISISLNPKLKATNYYLNINDALDFVLSII